MDYSWIIGVLLAGFASIVSNLGLNLQKLTHVRLASQPEKQRRYYYRRKLWMFGLLLVVSGSFFDFFALGFAAQSIIAPLGSLTLVANVFFAPLLLKEKISRPDLFGTALIVVGSGISVAFASHEDTTYRVDDLFNFYTRARFGIYGLSVVLFMTALWFAIQYFENEKIAHGDRGPYARLQKYHRFCYSALSGTVGAQSVLFAKCIAELLVNSIQGHGVLFAFWQTYVLLFCMGITVVLQIKWLNKGLKLFDALYVVPVFQSFWILVSVIAGLTFFGEYTQMDRLSYVMFPFGIIITIAGVYILSGRRVAESTEEISPKTPLMRTEAHIDPRIGFQGEGPPATFTASAMGRCSIVFSSVPAASINAIEDVSVTDVLNFASYGALDDNTDLSPARSKSTTSIASTYEDAHTSPILVHRDNDGVEDDAASLSGAEEEV